MHVLCRNFQEENSRFSKPSIVAIYIANGVHFNSNDLFFRVTC